MLFPSTVPVVILFVAEAPATLGLSHDSDEDAYLRRLANMGIDVGATDGDASASDDSDDDDELQAVLAASLAEYQEVQAVLQVAKAAEAPAVPATPAEVELPAAPAPVIAEAPIVADSIEAAGAPSSYEPVSQQHLITCCETP